MDPVIATLVEYVCARNGCPVDELVGHMGVCERTIRKYVRIANDFLDPCARIFKRRGGGYEMEVVDPAAFSNLRDASWHGGDNGPQNADERAAAIFFMLCDDWITVDAMAERLFVSPSTVSQSLVSVREAASDFGLAVLRRPHYGLRIDGPEFEKRLCLERMAVEGRCSRTWLSSLLGVDMAMAADCAASSLAAAGMGAEEVALRDATVSLALSVSRAAEGHGVSIPDEILDLMTGPRLSQLSLCLAAGCAERLGAELPEQERLFVLMHLAFWQGVDSPVEDSARGLTARILDGIERAFCCHFHDDEELRDELGHYVRLLCLRLAYKTPAQEPPAFDIQETLPFSFALANETCRMIERHISCAVPRGERDTMAFLYARALSRRLGGTVRGTTVIVSAAAPAVREYLRCRVRLEFGGDAVCVPSWDDLADMGDLSGVRCVLATGPGVPSLPVPVVRVSPYFTDDDLARVRRSFRVLPSVEMLRRAFDERLFVRCGPAGCVAAVAEAMERAGAAPAGFAQGVSAFEGEARFVVGDHVACVYPGRAQGERSAVGCAVLERPAAWADTAVRLVFVVSLAADASEYEARSLVGAVMRMAADRVALSGALDDGTHDGVLRGLLGFAAVRP